jgi:hypothetical protein
MYAKFSGNMSVMSQGDGKMNHKSPKMKEPSSDPGDEMTSMHRV